MVFVYALASWMMLRREGKWKDYGVLLNIWALRLALVFLLVMSFEGVWLDLGREMQKSVSMNIAIILIFSIVSAALHVLAKNELKSGVTFSVMYAAMFLAAVLMHDTANALSFQVLDNLILVFEKYHLLFAIHFPLHELAVLA